MQILTLIRENPSLIRPSPFESLFPPWFVLPNSQMNNPDNISESLESIFWVKILKFFDADPGLEHVFFELFSRKYLFCHQARVCCLSSRAP
jgi:hypothetical protein